MKGWMSLGALLLCVCGIAPGTTSHLETAAALSVPAMAPVVALGEPSGDVAAVDVLEAHGAGTLGQMSRWFKEHQSQIEDVAACVVTGVGVGLTISGVMPLLGAAAAIAASIRCF